jgi:hypothetical protein
MIWSAWSLPTGTASMTIALVARPLVAAELVTALALAVAGGRESWLIFPWALFPCPAFQLQAASKTHAQPAATNVERIEPS